MRRMETWIERLVLAFVVAVITVIFWHFGGFAVPAAVLLGLSFTIVAASLYALWRIAAFRPYAVEVFIHFASLRDDLGLTKPDSLPEEPEEPPYDIYRFTALSASVFGLYRRYSGRSVAELGVHDRYIHSDEEYGTAIALGGSIPCTLRPVKFENPCNNDSHPQFFFRRSRDGYEFGIYIVVEWWLEHRKQFETKLLDIPVNQNWEGMKEIVLAVLPGSFMPDDDRLVRFDPFKMRRRQLDKCGWKNAAYDPSSLEHRYLTVRHWLL